MLNKQQAQLEIRAKKRQEWARKKVILEQPTSIEDMNLVGLTVIFAISTENVEKFSPSNGVAGVAPPLAGPTGPSSVAMSGFYLQLLPSHHWLIEILTEINGFFRIFRVKEMEKKKRFDFSFFGLKRDLLELRLIKIWF